MEAAEYSPSTTTTTTTTTTDTIDYKIFKENLKNISKISEKISDNWHLKKIETTSSNHATTTTTINDDDDDGVVYYLEKLEPLFLNSNVYTFIYQIFYSFSYQVPVFYLNVYASNGKLLNIDEIIDLLKLNDVVKTTVADDNEYLDMLTITEHPYFENKSSFYIHPCKTSKWMQATVLNQNNYPLYFKSIANDLKYWFTIHTSLDVIEEKIRRVDFKDLYLGLLYLTEDFRIYGYITNTKTKFIVAFDTNTNQLNDADIRSMFKKLHTCYQNVLYNPFYNVGEPIKSKNFEDIVKSVMQQPQKFQQQPMEYTI